MSQDLADNGDRRLLGSPGAEVQAYRTVDEVDDGVAQPAPAPRITGAAIVGARPGHPFLFKVPATGDRPLTFAAEGLPAGLDLDPASGLITGSVETWGEYRVRVTAKNALGSDSRELRIVIASRCTDRVPAELIERIRSALLDEEKT